MFEITVRPIVLLAALKMEFDAVLKNLGEVVAGGGSRVMPSARGFVGSRRVVCVCTGVGLKRAGRAIERVLGEGPVGLVVNPGIAGGLAPDARPGDLFLCELVRGEAGESLPASRNLIRRAGEALTTGRIDFRLGRLVSVRRAVTDRNRKAQLFEESGCDLVDMEAHAIARACREKNLPFLPIKVVSDRADESTIPDVRIMDEQGRLRLLQVAAWAARHPFESARVLYRLRRNLALALDRLRLATGIVLRELAPE